MTWWKLAAAGPVAGAAGILASAPPLELEREDVAALALYLVSPAAVVLAVGLLGRAAFTVAAILEILFLLFLAMWGFVWGLPLALLHLAAILWPRRPGDRLLPRTAALAVGAALAICAAAVLVVPGPRQLWVCGPDQPIMRALQDPTGRGTEVTLAPGVDGVEVVTGGVHVELEAGASDEDVAGVRRRAARVPGVTGIRDDRPCPGTGPATSPPPP